ncbi:MAG: TonB-dependent receptor [Bacteroidia bacterium]|nr:TonB-dependent receptor [Bacteroidia bacterium]
MKRPIGLLAGMLLLSTVMRGQTVLEGSMYDRATGRPLAGAQIRVLQTTLDAVSDRRGYFTLKGLPSGVFLFHVSRPGYEELVKEVVVKDEAALFIGMSLLPTVQRENPELAAAITRFERYAIHTPGIVSAADREYLHDRGGLDISGALAGLGNLWALQQHAAAQQVWMRGMQPLSTALLADGLPLSTGGAPGYSIPLLSAVDYQSLERIEAAQSPGIGHVGASGTGGAVYAESFAPAYSSGRLQVRPLARIRLAFPNQEQTLHGRIHVSSNRVAAAAGVTGSQYGDRWSGQAGGFQEPSAASQGAAQLRVRVKLSPRHELLAGSQHFELRNAQHFDRTALQQFRSFTTEQFSRTSSSLQWRMFPRSSWLREISVTAGGHQWEEHTRIEEPGSQSVRTDRVQTGTALLVAEAHMRPNPYWNAVSGFEWTRDAARVQASRSDQPGDPAYEVRGVLPGLSGWQHAALYSLHTLDLLKLRLTAGGRLLLWQPQLGEAPAAGRMLLSGGISGMYPLHPDVALTAGVHSGRRAPTLYEWAGEGWLGPGFQLAADSLAPEQALTTEVGLKVRQKHFSGALSVFRIAMDRFIDWAPALYEGAPTYAGVPVWVRANQGQALLQGVEAEGEWLISRMASCYGQIAYQRGYNLSQDMPMNRIPPLNGLLGLQMQVRSGLEGSIEWRFASEKRQLGPVDWEDPRSRSIESWQTFNLRIGYTFGKGGCSLQVLNLLDAYYRPFGSGIPGRGRMTMLALEVGF